MHQTHDIQILPAPVIRLIEELNRLPGVGPKTASRLTFFLLRAPDDLPLALSARSDGVEATGAVVFALLFHHPGRSVRHLRQPCT
jgi:hypothetical protein